MGSALTPTSTAYLYVIGEEQGPFKLGFSSMPNFRCKILRQETKRSVQLLHWVEVPYGKARSIELHAHKLLAEYERDGEWFMAPFDAVVAAAERAPVEYLAIEHPLRPKPRYDKCAFQADGELFERLDNWRCSQPNHRVIPRGTAVRMLLEKALADVPLSREEALAERDRREALAARERKSPKPEGQGREP